MASKQRILLPPAWPNRRLASHSSADLKAAPTPPAITSTDYVSKLEIAFTEAAKLQEVDPNDTLSEARLAARSLARSSSAGPGPVRPVPDSKDRENSSNGTKRASSTDISPEKPATNQDAQPSRLQNRICLDPQMHPNQSHAEVHHPGLLPLADFCDSGVEAPPEVHTDKPEKTLLDRFWHELAADDDHGHPPVLQSNPPVHPRGRVYRALTGGDICVEPVDVSGHFHAGHAPILKVRPAVGVHLTPQRPSHHGHRDAVSKLGPFVDDNFQFQIVDDSKPDVKHQPSNYWGFTTKPDKLEEVPLDREESPTAGVISPSKPTDDYGPPDLGLHDSDHSLGDKAVELSDLPPVQPAQKPKDTDSDSWLQKRTTRWLKDLLHQPAAYSSKLTQLPDKNHGRRNTVSSPSNVRWGYQTDSSTGRPLTRHSVDHRYKATFHDMENILDNAVKLAKEAVDHFDFKPSKASSRASVHESHHQRSGSDLSGGASLRKRRNVDNSGSTLLVPVPQRISSLLRLGDMMEKKSKRTSPADSTDKDKKLPTPPMGVDMREENVPRTAKASSIPENHCTDAERYSMDGTPSDVVNFSTQYNLVQAADTHTKPLGHRLVHTHTNPIAGQDIELQERDVTAPAPQRPGGLNLRGRSHVSLRGVQGFSLARSHPRQPIARDWSDARKRYVASVACLSTALIGVLVGIYAGLVPSIQYYIVDLNHYAILGNVLFYFGLAIPSLIFWPLPLLHGRKPYILSGLVIAMPLLFPQAIAVGQIRSPYTSVWR